jgi:hypothetical protein
MEVIMIKAIRNLREWLEKDPKTADRVYKAVTFVAAAASIALIMAIALAERGSKSPPAAGQNIPENTIRPQVSASPSSPTDADHSLKASPEPISLTLTFTDKQASEIIAFSLADSLPMEDVSVAFTSPDVVGISGRINKKNIGALINKQDMPPLDAAMVLAPDILTGDMAFRLMLDENGSLVAEPSKIIINDINITKFIPKNVVTSANEALSSLLPKKVSLRSLSIADGAITFTLQA